MHTCVCNAVVEHFQVLHVCNGMCEVRRGLTGEGVTRQVQMAEGGRNGAQARHEHSNASVTQATARETQCVQ